MKLRKQVKIISICLCYKIFISKFKIQNAIIHLEVVASVSGHKGCSGARVHGPIPVSSGIVAIASGQG